MPRALVTGGSGYFGCLLVEQLLARGYDVSVFDLVDVEDRPPSVTFFQGDIRDPRAIEVACEGVDVIHHNVAQVPLAKSRHLFESVNIDGTRNLLDAAKKQRVNKIVVTSSSAIFGIPSKNPVDDTVLPRPREPYGRAKLEGEKLARSYVREHGLDVTIVRPRTILGHGRLGIFQILFEWVRTGKPVWLLGSGDNRYQFVHADDLADACIRAGEKEGPDTFNIGAERFGTMRELLSALVSHAKTGSRIRSLPSRLALPVMDLTSRFGLSPLGPYHALMYGREMFFDVAKAKEKLGWSARFGNEEMIVDSYDWYVAHRDEVLARSGASAHRSPVEKGVLRALEYLP